MYMYAMYYYYQDLKKKRKKKSHDSMFLRADNISNIIDCLHLKLMIP